MAAAFSTRVHMVVLVNSIINRFTKLPNTSPLYPIYYRLVWNHIKMFEAPMAIDSRCVARALRKYTHRLHRSFTEARHASKGFDGGEFSGTALARDEARALARALDQCRLPEPTLKDYFNEFMELERTHFIKVGNGSRDDTPPAAYDWMYICQLMTEFEEDR